MASLFASLSALSFVADVREEGDAVSCGLPYPEGVRAVLRQVGARLSITAALGGGEGRLTLLPQGPGVLGALDAASEIQLHEPLLDGAFIIRGTDAPLLLAVRAELARLRHAPPTRLAVRDAQLDVTWDKLPPDDAHGVIDAALSLWHRAVFHRLGIG